MPDYRRAYTPGATYFFTLVTYQRQGILCHERLRAALRNAIRTTQDRWPFAIDAWVLLPDHLHAIWTLPENDSDFSVRWSMIKRLVTKQIAASVGVGAHSAPYMDVGSAVRTNMLSESRRKRREGVVWQRRFWEHQVKDEVDLKRCCDYLHWNPVKHGYVARVADWPYSTFHRFVSEGQYPENWGGGEARGLAEDMFGE